MASHGFAWLRMASHGKSMRVLDLLRSVQMEVYGYHHNVAGDFLSLRPAVYAAGSGEVRIRSVRYEAL